ncbi:hypothetical protein KSP39_PZI016068 [Platanthera zijinensis]|uniref:Meiotic nuclear division protein 1 homolog n=1 Tax=Platanthera zijinensis TaxID=2320716 RepID=A0AAP0B9Y6_9ASPA
MKFFFPVREIVVILNSSCNSGAGSNRAGGGVDCPEESIEDPMKSQRLDRRQDDSDKATAAKQEEERSDYGESAAARTAAKARMLLLREKGLQLLKHFGEDNSFFQLKELEKLGPKKGVISQSVKDVVQSLVDDDLVLKDKIGTSVYFWSLPSCAGNQLTNARNKLKSDLFSHAKYLEELVEQRESLKRGREESDDREMALEELKNIDLQHKKLKEELANYADNDPAAVEAVKSAIAVAAAAGGRYTYNIFTLQHWCSSNFPQAKEQLEHMYKEVKVLEEFDSLQQLDILSYSASSPHEDSRYSILFYELTSQ